MGGYFPAASASCDMLDMSCTGYAVGIVVEIRPPSLKRSLCPRWVDVAVSGATAGIGWLEKDE